MNDVCWCLSTTLVVISVVDGVCSLCGGRCFVLVCFVLVCGVVGFVWLWLVAYSVPLGVLWCESVGVCSLCGVRGER